MMKFTVLTALLVAAIMLFGCAAPAPSPSGDAAPSGPVADLPADDPSAPSIAFGSPLAASAEHISVDNWREAYDALPKPFISGYEGFFADSAVKLLGASENSENRLYSPMSLYLAMAMLTECSANNTRAQLLSAMGIDGGELSAATKQLSDLLYFAEGESKFTLYNSAWLSDACSFNKDTLDKLAANMYADAYSADFTGERYMQDIADWVVNSTDGFLDASPDSFKTDPATIFMLLNTVYYKDEWAAPFNERNTAPDVFTNADSTSSECDFMNTFTMDVFARGEGYTAANMSLKHGYMRFILPDEGVTPYELISSPDKLAELMDVSNDDRFGDVTWKIPKFGYGSTLDLVDMLRSLGVTDAFSPDDADLSALTDMPAYVSRALQQSKIAIDENGIEVASCTSFEGAGAAMPDDEAFMLLTRPFVYIIYRADVPVFIGVVNSMSDVG